MLAVVSRFRCRQRKLLCGKRMIFTSKEKLNMKRSNAHKQLVTLVTCALLVAIQIVLVRFCSIQTPFQRISF